LPVTTLTFTYMLQPVCFFLEDKQLTGTRLNETFGHPEYRKNILANDEIEVLMKLSQTKIRYVASF